jgi:hypothetical protein
MKQITITAALALVIALTLTSCGEHSFEEWLFGESSSSVVSSSSSCDGEGCEYIYVPETQIPKAQSLEEVKAYTFTVKDGRTVEIFYRFPEINQASAKILLGMHGDGRKSDIDAIFKNISETENIIVVAPYFTPEQFTNAQYRYLDISNNINSPENWTSKIIDDIFIDFKQRFSLPNSKYILYGYSAGGISTQHMAMFSDSPYMEYSISAGSGGYLTPPDDQLNYPNGIKNLPMHKDLINRNFGRRMYLLSGNRDTVTNATSYTGPAGTNRHVRALYFYSYSKEYCERNGLFFNIDFITMDRVGHEIGKSLPHTVDVIKGIYDSKKGNVQ